MSSGSVDPELLYVIDSTACMVAHYAVAFEEKMKEETRTNPAMSFLQSTDANHALYLEKLAEYRAEDQDADTITVPATYTGPYFHDTRKIRVYDLPLEGPQGPFPEDITAKEYDTIKLVAQFAVPYGFWFLLGLRKRNDPRFDFLESGTDHKKFIVFRSLYCSYNRVIMPCWKPMMPSPEPIVEAFIRLLQGEGAFVTSVDYFSDIRQPPRQGPFPEGITAKEYDTIKLTAQFAVRYRTWFTEELKKRNDPRFDFVESESGTDDKFILFRGLCDSYHPVIMPCHKLRMPCMDPVVEAFIQLLQGESVFVSAVDYFCGIQLP